MLIKHNNRHFPDSQDVPGIEGHSVFEAMVLQDEVMAEPAQ